MQDFELTILTLILVNCFTMAMARPMEDEKSHVNLIEEELEIVFNVVFTLEIGVKMLASRGVRAYFANPWNVFDFVLVAIGYTPLLPGSNSASGLKVRTPPPTAPLPRGIPVTQPKKCRTGSRIVPQTVPELLWVEKW